MKNSKYFINPSFFLEFKLRNKNKMEEKSEILEQKVDIGELDNNEKQENSENKVETGNTELSSENFKLEVRNLPRSFGFGVNYIQIIKINQPLTLYLKSN
jgi:hypothetical protein